MTRASFMFAVMQFFPAPAAGQVAPDPVVTISRPSPAEPNIKIFAEKQYVKARIFYSGAAVSLTSPQGFSRTMTADTVGAVKLSPRELLRETKGTPEKISLTAGIYLGDRKAEKSIVFTLSELNLYIRDAAENRVDQGNELARSGDLEQAVFKYEEALDIDPLNVRASYNAALAQEKLGGRYLAADKYSDYLIRKAISPQDRLTVKRKAVQMARTLRPYPLVPVKAVELLEAGLKAVKGKTPMKAVYFYEAAQSLAPWWQEPYYAAGLLLEQLSYQNNMQHSAIAVQNLRLFLDAAAAGDARRADILSRIERLEEVERGLNAPPTIRQD